MIQDIFKKSWIHLVALVIFFLTTVIAFFPSYQGQKLNQSDISHWRGMAQESIDYKEQTGESTLWTNSMFAGMPTYYINFKQAKDPVDYIRTLLSFGMNNESGKFITGMILFYLLLIFLKVNPWLAIFGAITFAYGTNNLVLLHAGHNTKVITIMTTPMVILGVFLAYREKMLLGTLLFTLGMSMNLKSSHPQMTYYLGLLLFIYTIFVFIDKLKQKQLAEFIKASGLLVIGLLLAIGTTANKTFPIYEYSKDTMRGAPILKNNKSNDSSSKVEGLSWDYAMQWSNGATDLLSSFIPMVVGGSSTELIGKDFKFAKELRKRGASTRDMRAPMYWGSLPFTSGPIYFGAVIFFLFFLAAFNLEGAVKWWSITAVLLTFLLSMGKNSELINSFFFNFVPYYNKFRTPNSILSVSAVIIPLVGILGLQNIISKKTISKAKILYPGLGFILLTLLIGILGPGIFDMTSDSDIRLEQAGIKPSILLDDRAAMLRSSAIRSAILMAIALAGIWAYGADKLKQLPVIIIIGLIAVADLFTINLKYVNSNSYQSSRKYKDQFSPRNADLQILKDTDKHYRVIDNTVNPFLSSFASYFHKSIGGYHAAKLQRYQDIIEYHISKNNMDVLNMLNTKYFITGQPGKEEARLNSAALGNAWFINSIKMVPTAEAEIESLTDLDPLGEAVIHEEFKDYITTTNYEKNGSITLTDYKPNKLTYKSNSSSDQLAVFSEVWYGPDKGWKATIDGQPAEHIRANYILRAMKIPAGQHEVVFEFDPQSNKTGNMISWISSILLLLGLLYYGWSSWKGRELE